MHTPGPWAASYLDSNGQLVVKGKHIEICTCWHHCVGSIEEEMHANARLIAAAPDMLAALQEACEFMPEDHECLMGRRPEKGETCPDGQCRDHGCMVDRVNRWRAALAKTEGC